VADWLERRRALGQDRDDEVWEGVYHVAPVAPRQHGDLADQLAAALRPRARRAGLWPSGPVNIGVPDDHGIPDRAYHRNRDMGVYLPTAAVVLEIVSPDDETYEKFDFYFARRVEEVLVVDPERKAVEWYRRGADGSIGSGRSELLDLDEATLHAEIDWPPVA